MANPALVRKLHQTVIITIMAVFLGFPAFAAVAFPISPLTIGERHFMVEVASTQAQLEQGLMHRTSLATNRGMLFIFYRQPVIMWMKDTLIPLDMLFIDDSGNIVQIEENTTPESLNMIQAKQPVKAVLELAGGACKEQNIKVGDKVNHALFASATH